MSKYGEDNKERVSPFHLSHVTVEATNEVKYRVKMSIDGSEISLVRNKQTSVWLPPKSWGVSGSSKVDVIIKAGHNVVGVSFGSEQTTIVIDLQEVVPQFLRVGNEELQITGKGVFHGKPATVIASLGSSSTSLLVRSVLQRLDTEIVAFRHVMEDSTQKHVDTVIKYGVELSELSLHSKAAFSVLTATSELLNEQPKRDETVSNLAGQLSRVISFASKSLREAVDDNGHIVKAAIVRLYAITVDLAEFTSDYVTRSRFYSQSRTMPSKETHPSSKKLASSTIAIRDEQKVKHLASELEAIAVDLGRSMDVEALKTSRIIEETMLLERLKPLQINYSADRGCLDGTRVGLLDEIVEWALRPCDTKSPPETPNMFWVYSMPGVGKTALVHSICARLSSERRLGGTFFCRRDDPALSEPKYIVPTLICKLAEIWGAYRRLVAEKLRKEPRSKYVSAGYGVFSELLGALSEHPPHPLVLVIDALDECGDVQRQCWILNSLLNASSRVNWLRIIITSRHGEGIERFFERPDCIGRYLSRDLAAVTTAREDIRLFARSKLSSIADVPKGWPGNERLDQIVVQSGGLFLFVETLWRLLQESADRDQALDQVLSGESRDTLTGLYRLYSMVITAQIGEDKEKFRVLMQAIIVVGQYQSLPDESIAQLAGLDIGSVKMIVDKLGPLLYRDTTAGGGIRVRHLSVIDFLTSSSSPEELRVDIQQANRDIALACLGTMTLGLKFNICNLYSSFNSNREVTDLASRVERKMSKALQYSCLYWSDHLIGVADSTDSALNAALRDFAEGCRLLYWIEALSVMGSVPVGEAALRKLLLWVKPSDAQHIHLIMDTLRFLLYFHEPITTSAPHIYISCLPFLPRSTYLWRSVNESFKTMMTVEKGRMKAWPALPDALSGAKSHVQAVSFSPNNRYIACCDAAIRIWDVELGALVSEPLEGHTGRIGSVAYSPDGRCIVSGSSDKTILVWDATMELPIGEPLKGHTAGINSVAYSTDGQYIVSGSDDGTVRIWDAITGAPIGQPLKGHTDEIFSVAYSPDGNCIASGSKDYTVRTWDARTGAPIGQPLTGHDDWVKSVAYSPDGRYIVSGSDDETIRIWDVATREETGYPGREHLAWVNSVIYSPDGQYIASGSSDNTIIIWDPKTRSLIGKPLKGHVGTVNSVVYSPDGRYIASGATDMTVRIWDAIKRVSIGESPWEFTRGVNSVAYSPDGRFIVSSAGDEPIHIWDTTTGDLIGELLEEHRHWVNCVACSPDGRYLASGSRYKTVRIWDIVTRAPVGQPLQGHTHEVLCVAYSSDSRYIVSGSNYETIRIWDAKTGASIAQLQEGRMGNITSVVYSPDGRDIISASSYDTLRIWNATTKAPIGKPLKGHTAAVKSVTYSPDRRHIASGSADQTIRFWDAIVGAPVGEPLKGHTSAVTSVTYSPDGRYIASGSDDRTIRIWDAATKAPIGNSLMGHTSRINSIAYSPDGRHIVSCSDDRTIRVWDSTVLQNTHAVNLHPDSNGWVHHPNGGLWFWVPEECRHGLSWPTILTIPTTGYYKAVHIDLTAFSFGTSWTDIKTTDP